MVRSTQVYTVIISELKLKDQYFNIYYAKGEQKLMYTWKGVSLLRFNAMKNAMQLDTRFDHGYLIPVHF